MTERRFQARKFPLVFAIWLAGPLDVSSKGHSRLQDTIFFGGRILLSYSKRDTGNKRCERFLLVSMTRDRQLFSVEIRICIFVDIAGEQTVRIVQVSSLLRSAF